MADFYCTSCSDQYELKSKNGSFGSKLANGAYETKCARLRSSTNPNLILLNYDLKSTSVRDVLLIPKHFFTPEIVEPRKPLPPTARRAGWIGSNILLGRVPESGRIHVLRNGVVVPKDDVIAAWKRTLFLREQNPERRGWLVDVMRCVESLGKTEFTLNETYAFDRYLSELYPMNNNVRPKIRQQLQKLRDSAK